MLRAKQEQFCLEYIKDFNATQAAIRSGYSAHTAGEMGYENLNKPQIAERIKILLKQRSLSGEQAEKLVSDIAMSSINDYMKPRMVEHTPRITKGIKLLIKELREEMDFEEEFSKEANFNPEEWIEHKRQQSYRARQLARLKLTAKNNPAYTKIVDGETVLVERMELDLVKLSKDKERGRIKSISFTEFGPKIELFAADGALRDVLKIHGKYAAEKVEHTGNVTWSETKTYEAKP